MIAGSFGSLTSQPAEAQNVQGHGEYADGKWRVIFVRDLTSPQGEDAQFTTGQVYSLAFAAWDGANEERNGQKSTSQWVSLQLGDVATESATGSSGAAASAPSGPGGDGSSANALEGLPYMFVPMFALFGLVIVAGIGLWLLSKLPEKK